MITGRPKQPIVLQEEERVQLKAMAHSRSLPHGLVIRASLVLMAAEGVPNNRIAEKLDLSPQSVCKWRQRYLEQGPAGLHDELRPGRPRSISDEKVATLLRKTLKTKPKTVRTGASARWPARHACHPLRFIGFGRRSASNPIAKGILNSLPIPSSLRKSVISSGCT